MLNLDNNTFFLFPTPSLVVKLVVSSYILFGLLVFFPNFFYPTGSQLVECRIARETRYETNLLLSCNPCHELGAAKHTVAPYDDESILPFLTQLLDEANHQAGNIYLLVGTAWSKDGKYELPTVAFEYEQWHIAVFVLIFIEQGELLGAISIGVAIIEIKYDSLRLLFV